MTDRNLQLQLGIGALAIAVLLGLWGIPSWVSSPSNVRNIVLSPTFWPYALTFFTAVVALGLIVTGLRTDPMVTRAEDMPGTSASWLRLAGLAVIMALTMYGLPRLGMVWTAMLAFVATAFLFRTRHPKTALICAVVVPLVLYAFFAKVAGVAIPQGEFVRLP